MRIIFSTPLMRVVLAGLLASGALSAKPLAPGASAQSSRLADETGENAEFLASVSTNFGIYQPYAVPKYSVSVGRSEPEIAANFSNIAVAEENFPWASYFSAGERSMLMKNGFVARAEATASFGQAYSPETSSHDLGSFITVDAVLHGLRVTLDEATRDMERNYAAPALSDHLSKLSTAISVQLAAERNQSLSDALVRLLGYVQTAQALVNPAAPLDAKVQNAVNAELRKISAAAGEASSSVLPQQTINYALFAPEGYYAVDKQLASYYKAKVWLSHAGFNLRQANGAPDLAGVRTAAMLARMIGGLDEEGYFTQTLRNINEPDAFLAGHAESVAPWDILTNAMRGYYGRIVDAGPGFLADDKMLAGFVGYVAERLPDATASDRSAPTFRLIEWSAAPSHDLFDSIVSDQHATLGSYGMTLMASMGSVRASELLGARSGYSRGTSALFGSHQVADWVQDIDRTMLYTVQPLVAARAGDDSYPRFMRNDAWRSLELSSALGGWADYQHTPATMPMKSVAKAGSVSGPGGDLATTGYVEPNPEAWARVASLAGYIRNGLTQGRGEPLIGHKVELKLQDIENAAAKLMQMAAVELDGKSLVADQLDLLKSMPQRIAAYESFTDKSLQGDGFVVNAGAAGMGGAGSIANGHPLAVYVVVPRNDGGEGLMLTRGAVYSYYEVNASDADWRREISTAGGSATPDARLVGSFASTDRAFAQDAAKFLGVSAAIPATTARYTPGKTERYAEMSHAQLSLEKSVVSRGITDELWFTVHAPNLEGTQLAVTVANTSGARLNHTQIGSIKNGERLDVIRVADLTNGQYVIRVEDLTGQVLATGRFTVTR